MKLEEEQKILLSHVYFLNIKKYEAKEKSQNCLMLIG